MTKQPAKPSRANSKSRDIRHALPPVLEGIKREVKVKDLILGRIETSIGKTCDAMSELSEFPMEQVEVARLRRACNVIYRLRNAMLQFCRDHEASTDKTTELNAAYQAYWNANSLDKEREALVRLEALGVKDPGGYREAAKSQTTKPGGYPANINNPDDWAAFLARYLDNRANTAAHNGIGLVALHIVDAIQDVRRGVK